MRIHGTFFLFLVCVFAFSSGRSFAHDINLQPKYGSQPKNAAQKTADAQFLASIDTYYKGNRKKAARDVSNRGWQLLRQGNATDAMRRFNQAWLLDKTCGSALWGMAAVQADSGKFDDSLKLFSEAEQHAGGNIDFSADYARAVSIAGIQTKNAALLNDALARFERVHKQEPQHTLNLQNWAIALFYTGNYAEAWKKVKLAEATPRHAELDPKFIAALQNRMPRP